MTTFSGPETGAASRERSTVQASSLHEIHRLVERRGADTIALHVGEPHVRMPEPVAEAFVRAIRDGLTCYTDAPGLLVLREAIAQQLSGNGDPHPENVFVTPGSCQAIAAVLDSLPADRGVALLPEIHWPIHLQQILLAGLQPRFYSVDDGDAGPAEVAGALNAVYGSDVRVLIASSPANPSGMVLGRKALAQIHAWAVRHRVWLISDEAYEDFVFEGEPPCMAAYDSLLPETERVVFSVHTFSKGFSMTGCRLGYVTAPSAARAEPLRRVQEATLIAPSTPAQYAGLEALRHRSHLAAHHSYVRATRDEVISLVEPAGLLWHRPAGGWYALLDLSAYTRDTDAFVRTLLECAGVALAPGHGFVPPGHGLARQLVRLTLCAERAVTLEGIRRLLAFG